MVRLAAAMVLVLAVPAAAQVPPGFDPSVCRYLPKYRPAPDVDYIPGVDVRGRPVAPADLPGSAGLAESPDLFEIPVTLDVLRGIGVPTPGGVGLPGRAQFGTLTIRGNQVLFNGQPIGGQSEARLQALCGSLR